MATRRRKIKHIHNKTRTTSKALLRKTRHKNKKNKTHRVKNNRTKKVYQRGGGPKAPKTPNPAKTPKPPKPRAKGGPGDKVEPKVSRRLKLMGQGHPDLPERHIAYKKENPTAEFDIPIHVSELDYNISVKSVKRKTPGQKSFTIMCGDARRFLTELGSGNVPYHMVIGIRQQHSTKPNKKEVVGCEIDLRAYKGVLFGRATDEEIKFIIDESNRLSKAYCDNSAKTKPEIDAFNASLERLGSKLRLAPKKENYDKKRDPRVQATFSFVPEDPINKPFLKPFELSSMENSPEDQDNGTGAGEAAMDMSTGQSAQSLAPVKTSRRSGIHKKPVEPRPPTEYFRSFKPKHESSILSPQVIALPSPKFVQPSSAGPALFSTIPPIDYAQGFSPVHHEDYGVSHLPPISERGFPTSPAFTSEGDAFYEGEDAD